MHGKLPYGCNDNIDGIGILSNPTCRSVNVMDISNFASRCKRSHGHRHYTSPIFHDVSLNVLLPFMQKRRYASHSLETIFTITFKTTCLVQLMFGKPCYKSEFE